MTAASTSWPRVRLRYLFDEIDNRVGAATYETTLLSVSIHRGVVPRSEMTDREARADDFVAYKRVRQGDIVINRMRAFEGGAGVSDYAGIVSSDYAVLRTDARLDSRFFHHLVRSRWFVGEMTARLRGIGGVEAGNVRTPRINVEDLGDIVVAIPSLAEQRSISDYLDAATRRIDGLVELRGRILALLAERRRLASDRMLADSGSTAWPVVKLKYVVRGFIDTLHATAPGEDDGPGLIVGTACIKSGSLNLALARRCSTETIREWTKRALPQPGDVLLTREAPAGEAALVPAGIDLAPGQRVVLVQTDRHRMLPDLVLHSIYSARAGRFFDLLGRETTVAHLNMGDIGELPVVLPPLEVQPVIAARIGAELASLDQASSAMSRQIESLLERRQALITAAVTGQIEIPGIAA